MPGTIDLATLTLDKGSHRDPSAGACLLEATALFAGEAFTDHPPCVSRVLADFGISLNDRFDDGRRQELKRFIPLLPGTANDGLDEQRGYLALDWLIRTYTPAFLDLRPELADVAAELRSLRRIVDLASAQAAGPVARKAQDQSAAAWAAAWDAAWDAAGDAAGDAARAAAWDAARAAAGDAAGAAAGDAAGAAAWDAAWDAAGDAAGDAARAAAWDAARAAAWDAARAAAWNAAWDAARAAAGDAARAAARAALKPTVDQLQTSAVDLYDRMIRPS